MEEGIKVNGKKGWRWCQYLHCMRFKWQQSRGLWWHLVRLWLSVQWTYDQGPLPTVSSNTMWAAPPSVTQCYMPAQPDQFAIQYSIWQMYLLLPINSYFSSFPFWLDDWMKPSNFNISLSKPDRFQGQSVLIADIVTIKAITKQDHLRMNEAPIFHSFIHPKSTDHLDL